MLQSTVNFYKTGEKGGNKSLNLRRIAEIKNPSFVIPSFEVFLPDQLVSNNIHASKVAVRSDSSFEDGVDKSGAGTFTTVLNVDNTISAIEKAITQVQEDALSKAGQKIPIIVQEMVINPEYAGVIFSIDTRNNNPDYFLLNYTKGLGNKVVDGDNKTKTRIIHKDHVDKTGGFMGNLTSVVKDISRHLKNDKIDVEFAYKDGIVYILQVRPITAISGQKHHNGSQIKKKLFDLLQNKLDGKILGDMIDINPAELLGGSRDRLINTFFNYIFPQNALLAARGYFGYGDGSGMEKTILDKTYIDLEKNLLSFLPSSLSIEEYTLFISYYKTLLNKKPSLQNQLDTVEYPIDEEKAGTIINSFKISQEEKETLITKFNVFFSSVKEKCHLLAQTYKEQEKSLIEKYFPGAMHIGEAHNHLPDEDTPQIVDKIIFLCTEFAKHARGAFFFIKQDIGEGYFYKNNRYTSYLSGRGENISLPNGFDFLSIQSINFTEKQVDLNIPVGYTPSDKEILETARENIKYMFMLYIAELGKKISGKTQGIKNIKHADFVYLLKNIFHNDRIQKHADRRKENNELTKYIQLPPIIYDGNIGSFELNYDEGIYYNYGIENTTGEVLVLDNIFQYSHEEVLEMSEGKIILFTNATPEIDSYLPHLKGAKALVTKYGGPGAHIVLKIREMNHDTNDKVGLVVGIGDRFDQLSNTSVCKIDFTSSLILS